MKWSNHIIIAASTTAIISPLHIPIAIAGATAPDWIELLYTRFTGRKVPHRGWTHYVTSWVGLLLAGLFLFPHGGLVVAFAYGGLTHVFADSLTVSGVPFSPLSDRRFHLFGGRLKTGMMGEYFVSWGIGAACLLLAVTLHTFGGWYPFFYNYPSLYEQGLIDGSEWRERRFNVL